MTSSRAEMMVKLAKQGLKKKKCLGVLLSYDNSCHMTTPSEVDHIIELPEIEDDPPETLLTEGVILSYDNSSHMTTSSEVDQPENEQPEIEVNPPETSLTEGVERTKAPHHNVPMASSKVWSDGLQVLHDVNAKVIISDGIDLSDIVGANIEVAEAVTPIESTEDTLVTIDENVKILVAANEDDFVPLNNNILKDDHDCIPPQSQQTTSKSQEFIREDDIFDENYVEDHIAIDPAVLLEDRDDPNYIPALSDENSSDSSSEEESEEVLLNNTTTPCDPTDPTRKKRKRNRKAIPAEWEKNKIKKLRMSGQKYTGYERKKVNGKMVVSKTNFEREERQLGRRCDSKVCKANKKRKCTEFTEAERTNIFKTFWDLTWKEKEIFVCSNVTLSRPKVSTCGGPSRRSGTVTYRLKHEGVLKPVCKKFFLNTLGLGEWTALNWIKNNELCSADGIDEPQEMDDEEPNVENENLAANEITTAKRRSMVKTDSAREWLEMLPKLPSHYARKDTNKLYLEPIWESKSALYREYQRHSVENNKPCASLALFFDLFEDMKLSIFTPRKDQCDLCCSYKVGNVPKDVWDKHISEKNRARLEKENDKLRAIMGEIYCLNADVQAVKITPMVKASALYYKTKLSSHNFSLYNLSSHQCTCYWFNECEGDSTANTYASCIFDYLEEKCLNPKLPIVLYTDGCTAQNRNHILANALLLFSAKHQIQVFQNFLIKGHTQMEGDSVHAKIEKKLKNKDVYLPYEFLQHTKEARMDPFPYDVKYLKYDFFKDFSNLNYYPSIRPGRKTGDSVVTDIHCLKYDPSGIIQYKLQFDDEYKDLPRRPSKVQVNVQLKNLHARRLPIQRSKWNHLQDLKSVIPEDFHSFYNNLPYV